MLGLLLGLLRRRDRHHAGQSQDGAGLFERQPDGLDRRRARHGPGRRRQSVALDRAPSMPLHHMLVKGGLFLAVGVVALTAARASWPIAAACRRAGARPRRPALDRRRAGQTRGQGAARRRRRGPARQRSRRSERAFSCCISCSVWRGPPRRTNRRQRPQASPCHGRRWRWRPSPSPGCFILLPAAMSRRPHPHHAVRRPLAGSGRRRAGARLAALGETPAACPCRRHLGATERAFRGSLRPRRRVGARGPPAAAMAGSGPVAAGDRHGTRRRDPVRP